MNTRLKAKQALLLLPFILLVTDSLAQRYAGPLSPEESLKKLNIVNGLIQYLSNLMNKEMLM